MSDVLPKSEYDVANNILEAILTQNVENIELTDTIPPINDVTDSNKVFKGELSILFVDMRKSTDLTDELKSKKMVKVYRAFIRMVVQAIRYCGGQSRQFAGDGVMGVFQNSTDAENPETSCEKAVRAARYILTLIDYCLNPQLQKHMGDVSIGCGVGICTGTIMVTKIGMRGKEADDTAENELGIAWVGSTTNYASRFCGLAAPREIFIDETTHKGITDDDGRWSKETRVKGTKAFTGYVSRDYYLILPDDIGGEPVISDESIDAGVLFIQEIFGETEARALSLVDEISKKSAELSDKLNRIGNKEKQLNEREQKLNAREQNLALLELEKEYQVKTAFVDEAAQKFTSEKISSLGKDYWVALINRIKELCTKVYKRNVDGGLSWRISEIYNAIQLYDEYYYEVCNMAKHGFSIWESEIQTVLDKTYLRSALRDDLKDYISTHTHSERCDEYKKLLTMIGE